MSQNIITFDIAKAEASGRKIRTEADKLKRMADKLKRAVDDTPSWWVGSSRNGFIRQANELIEKMYEAVDLVKELGEDITAIAKAKKEEEARLKAELIGSLAVEFGTGATGDAVSEAVAGYTKLNSTAASASARYKEYEKFGPLLNQYAGLPNSPGYKLSVRYKDPDLLRQYLTPYQNEVLQYNLVNGDKKYTDEQKCRMILSLALGVNINEWLVLPNETRLNTIKMHMMPLFYSTSLVDKKKLELLLKIHLSEDDNMQKELNVFFLVQLQAAYFLPAVAQSVELLMDSTQWLLDIIGVIPGTEAATLLNTAISLLRRKYYDAALKTLGLVPFAEIIEKTGKLPAVKVAEIYDAVNKVATLSDKVGDILEFSREMIE